MELKDIMEDNDFSLLIETSVNLGTTLSRLEIEEALVLNNVTLPLSSAVRFGLTDGSRYFLVMYLVAKDIYVYERLSLAL